MSGDKYIHHKQDYPTPQKPPRRKKGLIAAISILLVVGISAALLYFFWGKIFGDDANITIPSSGIVSSTPVMQAPVSSVMQILPSSVPQPQPIQRRVRFAAVGDNLIHSAIYQSAQANAGGEGYDFSYCYAPTKDFFADFDINWINQETLITNEIPADTYPTFATPAQLGAAAYDAGFRVFALSNNHTYDKGAAGVSATLRYWQSMPQDTVSYGLYKDLIDSTDGIALQEVNGLTFAYVAFTFGTNGIPTPADTEAFVIYTSELEAMENKVRTARDLADVVVVSAHWGTENSHIIHQSQRDLGASFANWGADVIIGTHPHVIQDIEWIESAEDGRKVLLIHSLGNFLSAQSQPNQLVGLAVTFDLVSTEYPDGTISPLGIENVQARPTVTQYESPDYGYYDHPRTYFLSDYTEELAQQHYVRASVLSSWGREYIEDLCRQHVSEEFLVIE